MKLPEKWQNFGPFLWHGFFLALTMAMFDLNTVLPTLISRLSDNPVAVGAIFSLMLGAPLLFNLPFSRFQNRFARKRPFLLAGIYLRGASFVGMALVLAVWGKTEPLAALLALAGLILLFSLSGGFAGLAYTELIGRLIVKEQRSLLYASRQVSSGVAALAGSFFLVWLFQPGNQAFPWNYSLGLLVGAGGLLLGALGFWRIKEKKDAVPDRIVILQEPGHTRPDVRKSTGFLIMLKDDPQLLRFILVENLSGFGLMLLPFYMVHIQSVFPDSASWMGLFILAQSLGAIFSNFVWTRIARIFGPPMVSRLCMLAGGSLPLIALLVIPLGLPASLPVFVLIGFVMSGRNIGFEPWLLEIAPAEKRTLYLGIRGTASVMIAFLPLAGGMLIRWAGFGPTFILVAAVMLASSFLIPRPKEKP